MTAEPAPVLELGTASLEALVVVRDAPLVWSPPGEHRITGSTFPGHWYSGDLVQARLRIPGEPLQIATFANVSDQYAPCRWMPVAILPVADFPTWNGNWAYRAGRGDARVSAWCAALEPVPDQPSRPPGAPSTHYHQPLPLLRDGNEAAVPERDAFWRRIAGQHRTLGPDFTAAPAPTQARIVADLVGRETTLMNQWLADTVTSSAPAPVWDPAAARILVPPGTALADNARRFGTLQVAQLHLYPHVAEVIDRALTGDTSPRAPAPTRPSKHHGRARGR